MQRALVLAMAMAAAACGGSHHVDTPKPGSGSAPSADDQELALDPSIRHGVLPNGLSYYIKANKKPEKRAHMWLAVNAGSVLETDEQRGLAHMVEHLAFEGTKRFPAHEIQNFLERAGMKFGADLNAYTSFDETVYQLVVPTDDAATLGKGLDVLRDWSADITFDPKEVVDERKIIEEERRTRNNVGFRLLEQTIPVEFQGSPYAQRLPIGTTDVINGATADKLVAYYRAWYRPELMAVIVVGDIDAAAIEQQIQTKFGDIARGANAPARPEPKVETAHPPRFVVARDRENAVVSVTLAYQLPHRPDRTARDFRRGLVEAEFAQLLDDRLDIMAKRAQATWTNASVGWATQLRPADELLVTATVKTGKLREAAGDLAIELARVRQHGFNADEVKGAAAALRQKATEAVREAETEDSGDLAEEILRNYLVQEELPGPQKELELVEKFLPTITNDELVAVAKSIADRGRVTIVRAPVDAAVPSEKEIADQIAAVADKPVGAWEALDLSQPLIASEPAPGKITAEKQLSHGVTQWTLSNGATLYLKPTAFKKDEVVITATSSGGTSLVSDADFAHARFASAIVNATGVGNYGPEELHKKLAGKKVELESTIDEDHEAVTGSSSPDDLEPMLQLVYAAFTAPRTDEAAFAAWKQQQQQVAAVVEANAQAKFVVQAFDYLFQNHARIPLPFPTTKQIDAVKLDAAIAQYKARMANAADFTFVLVGAFDSAKVKPLVERYLASLPANPKAKREVIADVGLRPRTGTAAQTFRAGTEDKSTTLLLSWVPQPFSLDAETDTGILQRVLDIELLEVLREKLGGTYSVTIKSDASRSPPQLATLFVLFESAPANAVAMQGEAWKTLERIATTPISDDTLAKVREQIKKDRDTQLEDNAFWTTLLARTGRFGDDLDKLLALDRILARATKPQIQKSARTLLGKNRSTMTLLPEKTK